MPGEVPSLLSASGSLFDIFSSSQVSGDGFELFESNAQIFNNALCQHIRRRQGVGALQTIVAQPEDIQIEFVAFEQVFIREFAEAFGLAALMAIPSIVALDEILQM